MALGGSGNHGGDVTVSTGSASAIVTEGIMSTGIYAGSIGSSGHSGNAISVSGGLGVVCRLRKALAAE